MKCFHDSIKEKNLNTSIIAYRYITFLSQSKINIENFFDIIIGILTNIFFNNKLNIDTRNNKIFIWGRLGISLDTVVNKIMWIICYRADNNREDREYMDTCIGH